jgi:hypothetical protein
LTDEDFWNGVLIAVVSIEEMIWLKEEQAFIYILMYDRRQRSYDRCRWRYDMGCEKYESWQTMYTTDHLGQMTHNSGHAIYESRQTTYGIVVDIFIGIFQ